MAKQESSKDVIYHGDNVCFVRKGPSLYDDDPNIWDVRIRRDDGFWDSIQILHAGHVESIVGDKVKVPRYEIEKTVRVKRVD